MPPSASRTPAVRTSPSASAAQELAEILSVRGAAREEKLLASKNLESIVGLMPPEELFFTLKEVDEDHVSLVLSCARPHQLQFLLDLDLWKKDRLRPDRLVPWMTLMAECGSEAMVRWLRGLDPSTWVLLLGSVAKVRAAEQDSDPLQETPGLPPFTLDGVHYVSVPAGMEDCVRDALVLVRGESPDLYFQLVESMMGEVDSELEERCYQERQRRLAERGFPDWEEAYEIYARLPAISLDALPRRSPPPDGETPQPAMAAPRYPVQVLGDASDLLVRALRTLHDPAALETVRADLAHLTNKLLVADSLDVTALDSFEHALRKTAGYVSIGLELLCGPDEERSAEALRNHWLQDLFRAGWTRIRAIQSQARRFFDKGWPAKRMERLLFLDSPLPEVLDGLLRRHPLWYAGEEEPPPYREFRTLSEVERAGRMVEKAEFLGKFLLSVINFRLRDVKDAGRQLDPENLKGRTVFLTALLNTALGKDFQFRPLDRNEVPEGLQRLWSSDAPPRRVRPELMESAVEWSRKLMPLSGSEEAYMREFVGDAMAMIEEEFGHLAPDELPDPRFTRGLWIA